MKTKIFGGIAVLAIAAAIAFNVNLSTKSNGLSDISLANVEALAQDENGDETCGTKYSEWQNGDQYVVEWDCTTIGTDDYCIEGADVYVWDDKLQQYFLTYSDPGKVHQC